VGLWDDSLSTGIVSNELNDAVKMLVVEEKADRSAVLPQKTINE